MTAEIEDTYAEAFPGYYSRILVTARNKKWLLAAVNSATGFATSGVGCSCEAGLDHIVEPKDTPDGRIGAVLQFWKAPWEKDPIRVMEMELIHRIGQCLLTTPTTAVWNATKSEDTLDVGRKLGFYGDGFQKEGKYKGRTVVRIPEMMGEFIIEKDIGYKKGVMGGNLWFFCKSEECAIHAAELAVEKITGIDGVIAPFPMGICSCGSKVGARNYKFLIASTNEKFCPTLRDEVEDSQVPENVKAISEVVFNGISEDVVKRAMCEGIRAAMDSEGLVKISAGNYGGKLGKYRFYLRDCELG
jgi:formylmethanofuran--tetrahydromethanopterin N-formyltransferase